MSAMEQNYAGVHWQPIDIRSLKPDWSNEKCVDFLDSIEQYLEESMIAYGWGIISSMISTYETEEVADGD